MQTQKCQLPQTPMDSSCRNHCLLQHHLSFGTELLSETFQLWQKMIPAQEQLAHLSGGTRLQVVAHKFVSDGPDLVRSVSSIASKGMKLQLNTDGSVLPPSSSSFGTPGNAWGHLKPALPSTNLCCSSPSRESQGFCEEHSYKEQLTGTLGCI